ncbi:MAG: sulfite exporter TauE/SafE family protein [Bryobacteraceae bacterium]|nr:sulfite exporter TauE/SafE family protein [Bryobacteraceae bacterium]
MAFAILTAVVAFLAGAVASISGFGIGSILTPFLALHIDTRLAVAAVSIPHFLGTALRFWRLRESLNRHVFLRFGITSAAGGLTGAALHSTTGSPALAGIFAALLLFAGFMSLTGQSERLRFPGRVAWIAGFVSGLLGGLVGNQGGIRSAALFGFPLDRHQFVATATAVALIVDLARIPVYLASSWSELLGFSLPIGIASAGLLAGTLAGEGLLRRIPEHLFRRAVAVLLIVLGVVMAYQAL